jgi:hypothetical protein
MYSQAVVIHKTAEQIKADYKEQEIESGIINGKYCVSVGFENQIAFFWFKDKKSFCNKMHIYPYHKAELNRLINFYDSTYKIKDGNNTWMELLENGNIQVIKLHIKGELFFFEIFCKQNVIIRD